MYLAYMDECGNTGKKTDPDQPIHFLGCLVVEDRSVRPLEEAVRDIALKYFPKAIKKPKFEFHGVDLFGGSGLFRGTRPEVRIAATQDLISAASEHAAGFGFTGLNKLKSKASDHPHRICFTLLMERLESWLTVRDGLGLLISDENQEVEQDLIRDIDTFKRHATQWGYKSVKITRVIDSIHFVKSYNNPVIQLADVITYLTQRNELSEAKHLRNFLDQDRTERGSWSEWIPANYSRAELATRELCRSLTTSIICRKIWPD